MPEAEEGAASDVLQSMVEGDLVADDCITLPDGVCVLLVDLVVCMTDIKIHTCSLYCAVPPFCKNRVWSGALAEVPVDLRNDIVDDLILDPFLCVDEYTVIVGLGA